MRKGFLAVSGLLVFVFFFAGGARAAVCTVNALTDSNAGTGGAGGAGDLRYCINQTNAAPGADTINVTVSGTVALGSALPLIGQSLTINGSGQTALIIDGGGISGPLSSSLQPIRIGNNGTIVSIANLTIRNGKSGYGGGGAIYMGGDGAVSALTLTNVTLDGNTAQADEGGAVNCRSADLTIVNSRIVNNRTLGDNGDGGGIAFIDTSVVPRTLVVKNTTISGNATQPPGGFSTEGGGIYNNSGNVRIENSTISGNTASSVGGGIATQAANGATFLTANATISGNTAGAANYGGFKAGGGIYAASPMTIRNTTVAGNATAGEGGGIYHAANALTIANVIVAGNTAGVTADVRSAGITRLGGNIFKTAPTGPFSGPGTVTIADPLLNPLGSYGGATQTQTLQAGSPARDAGANAEALDPSGAALTVDQRGAGYPRVVNSTVDLGAAEFSFLVTNDSSAGAGSLRQTIADAPSGSTIQFDPVFFAVARSISVAFVGELYVNKTLTINGPAAGLTLWGFDNDTEAQSRIFFIDTGGVLNLSNVRMTQASGAVYNAGTFNGSGLTIDSGSVSGSGGAIYNAGTLSLSGSTLNNNNAYGGSGGAIYNESGRTATVLNCTFRADGTVGGSGGAIASYGTLSITGSAFLDNPAYSGGALFVGGGRTTANNSTFSGNFGYNSPAKGGAVHILSGAIFDTTNSTIAGNTSNASQTGGIFIEPGGTCNARNTIIAGNTNPSGTGAQDVSGVITSFGYNLLGNPTGSSYTGNTTGNLTGAANLAPLGSYGGPTPTFALFPNSPAINAGDPSNPFATDQRGAARPLGGRGDIGAFERNVAFDQATLPNGVHNTFYNQTLTVTRLASLAAEQPVDLLGEKTAEPLLAPFTFALVSGTVPTGLTLAAGGQLSGTPTVPGTYSFIVRATDADGMAGVAQYSITITNSPPTIGGALLSRAAGSALVNTTIATVNDLESGAGGVAVAVTSANPSNGVTISNVVNANGTVTADLVTACGATGASFTLTATDTGGGTATSTLTVNVPANTPPALVYQDTMFVGYGGAASLGPATATDNGTVAYSIFGVGPALTTPPTVDAAGIVSVTNARPVGVHTITVRATDNCSLTTNAQLVAVVTPVVTKTADTNDGVCDTDCSLREAVAVVGGGETIRFSPLFDTPQTVGLNSQIGVGKTFTIDGTGRFVTISGSNQTRLFQITSGGNLTLNRLTLTGGREQSGAVGGGAVLIDPNGAATVVNSTVTGNATTSAGGGFNVRGALTVRNSTIAGNAADSYGGGIMANLNAVVSLVNTTITGNSTRFGNGGGLNVNNANVGVRNTIIAGNLGSAPDAAGAWNSLGYNLIGSTIGMTINGDPTGNLLNQDARLAPFGGYGGPTPVYALLADSPAINAGDPVYDANIAGITDQRGVPRSIGGRVDIGAFEQTVAFDQPTVPNAVLNQPYNLQLTAVRQTDFAGVAQNLFAPAVFEIVPVAGQGLPPGLGLSPGGLLAGTPTTAGSYAFTVKATDTDGAAGAALYVINVLTPTAAGATLSGRVLSNGGQPLVRALVTLTDASGRVRTVRTNSFGKYLFENVGTGENYVLQAAAKGWSFAPRVVAVTEDLAELDLTAEKP